MSLEMNWSLVGSKGRAVPKKPVFSQALQLRPNNGSSARVMAVLGPPARMSAVEFLHCFLEVGVKPGHAAGKEGVHHALRKVTAEVGLEERDQAGLVRLPVKARPGLLCVWSRKPAQGNGPDSGVSLGSLPRASLWTCFFSGWKRVLSWMLPWPHQAIERRRTPTSSPGGSFVPCARFTRQRLSENSLLYRVLGGTDMMLPSVHLGQRFSKWPGSSWGFLTPFQGVCKVRAIFVTALRCDLPFPLPFSQRVLHSHKFYLGQDHEGMGFVETTEHFI